MATVTSLTADRILELASGWEGVTTHQGELDAALSNLTANLAANQAALDELNGVTLPALEAELSANDVALAELNDVVLPNLDADLAANSLALLNLDTVILPGLQSGLDANAEAVSAITTMDKIKNGGFEFDLLHWVYGETVEIDFDEVYEGVQSACLYPGIQVLEQEPIPVSEGQVLRLEFWYKTSAVFTSSVGSRPMRQAILDGAETPIPGHSDLTQQTDWTLYSVDWTVDSETASAHPFRIDGVLAEDEYIWIDSVSLHDVTTEVQLQGELAQLDLDLTANVEAITELNTVTLPALDTRLTEAEAAVAAAGDTTQLQADLDAAEAAVAALQLKFPITAPDIAANAVTANAIDANAVTATAIAAGAVVADKIDTNAVTANAIAAGAVVAGKIDANAVTASTIDTNAVTANAIAAGAVVAGKIDANAVTAVTIAANAVVAGKINAGAVTTTTIEAGAVTANKIATNTITANEIATDAITANELKAGEVTAIHIATNTITANEIATDAITANELKADAVTATHIFAGAVTANAIATDAVTANKIEAGAVTAAKILAGAISAVHIQANTIGADKLLIGVGTNSITNPGAEDGTIAPHIGNSGSWSAVTNPKRSGAYGFRCSLPDSAGTAYRLILNGSRTSVAGKMPVKLGDTVRFEFWARAGVATGFNALGYIDQLAQDGTVITNSVYNTAKPNEARSRVMTTSYQMMSAEVTITDPTVAYVGAAVGTGAVTSTDVLHVDDCQLSLQVTGSLLVNGAIDGQTITGSILRTAASGQRIEISDAIYGYSGAVGELRPARVDNEGTYGEMVFEGSSFVSATIPGAFLRIEPARSGLSSAVNLFSPSNTLYYKADNSSTGISRLTTDSAGVKLFSEVLVNALADGGTHNSATGAKYCRVSAAGVLYASTNAPSSRQIKHDIVPLDLDPEVLLSAQSFTFRYDDDPSTIRVGGMAEDFHEAGLNVFVGYEDRDNPERPTGIDYDGLTMGLLTVDQHQQRLIDALAARVTALEGR